MLRRWNYAGKQPASFEEVTKRRMKKQDMWPHSSLMKEWHSSTRTRAWWWDYWCHPHFPTTKSVQALGVARTTGEDRLVNDLRMRCYRMRFVPSILTSAEKATRAEMAKSMLAELAIEYDLQGMCHRSFIRCLLAQCGPREYDLQVYRRSPLASLSTMEVYRRSPLN
jgi:hypothetical protein